MKSADRLTGKVGIETGGACGIGEATVRVFASQGTRVVIANVEHASPLAADVEGRSLFRPLDVTDEAAWSSVCAEAEANIVPIDILLNNAAIVRTHLIVHYDLGDFEDLLRVNLCKALLGMKQVGRAIIGRRRGSIVNVSSTHALKDSNAMGAYASSKWALRGLSRVAALEFGPHGARVNSVYPGPITAPMSNPTGRAQDEMDGDPDVATIPIQRVARPAEVAQGIFFLASGEASYLVGTELAIDGWRTSGRYLSLRLERPKPRDEQAAALAIGFEGAGLQATECSRENGRLTLP